MNAEPNGCFGILLNEIGEILLLRDNRNPRKLNLPGGGLGMGELPVDTLVRETYEETGREISRDKLKYVGVYITRKRYGVVFLYTSTEALVREHPPHECNEVTNKIWMHQDKVLLLPDTDIYPAQRTLVRYYAQWCRDGERTGVPGYLSPPFEVKGKYFDNL